MITTRAVPAPLPAHIGVSQISYATASRDFADPLARPQAEAIRTAAGTLRDLRVAEVVKQDIHLDEGGAITYRTKLQLSFKYEPEH